MFNVQKEEISDDEVGKIIKKDFENGLINEYLLFGEDRVCLPRYFEQRAADVDALEISNDDVILASFPKSGTTWVREMVWLIENDLNYEGAKVDLRERFPELPGIFNPRFEANDPNFGIVLKEFKAASGRRLIKTHLPFSLLPRQIRDGTKTPKIIFVMRNPKDVFVSYHHMGLLMMGWLANREDFAKAFLADKVLYAPYWQVVHGYWTRRALPNVLILKYEEMIKDLKSVLLRTSAFLGKDPMSEEQLERLCAHLSFDSMKGNPAVNSQKLVMQRRTYNPNANGSFMRSGRIGDYKAEMSPRMVSAFDAWIKKNIQNTDFDEQYAYFGQI
ncbi:hypothetical protein PPYR_03458 [Photinus pyralis]|uniref:Sulfotransferase domain-containing protein n=1 Tax=Photinus pyralis TaxID=7054 RepID=A0A5N4A300_PHOPY|nr:sulfotransferase 1E1-like [Photinus pyralis]KAB0791658.1 hypothetical protein PPYR_03458 [Photinus pyralis]